ncbi:MAG TPA: trypsin-like peptidase domain-containing protein [Gemmataceae bacterium]|nr:trypsin-like peptidase domain-containing protein [Gemmataceae bacterium]
MAGFIIQCPSCHASLRSDAPPAPGSSIRCHKCNAVLRTKAKPADPHPADQEPDEDAPAPARKPMGQESRQRRPEAAVRPTQLPPREDEPARPQQRRPRDDDEEPAPRRRSIRRNDAPSRWPIIIGLSVLSAVILLVVATAVILIHSTNNTPVAASNSPPPPTPPSGDPPIGPGPGLVNWPGAGNQNGAGLPNGNPPVQVVDGSGIVVDSAPLNPPPTGDLAAPAPPANANGVLPADVLDKLKKATVYIRVTSAEGVASGSGFFETTSGLVLTNAHVVSMLHAGDPPPKKIDVVLRSGEKDEKTLPGRIVGVDRVSDLAVLSVDVKAVGLSAPPASLTVSSAAGLHETHPVYVAGFPLGEGLGKDITIRQSSVASLRKDKNGLLARVQITGGMDPGNSGGPVVDSGGNVVGVSVAKILGTEIDFAIPGDAVQAVFRGRCSEIRAGEPFHKGDQFAVPVDVVTIDPMHSVHSVAVDWWIGDAKDVVGPSNTPPAAPAPPNRQTTPLTYQPDKMTGRADIILPSLPPAGKVLWVQPTLVDAAGHARWVSGLAVPTAKPVDAKPAALTLHPPTDRMRLTLKNTATLQLHTGGQEHSLVDKFEAQLLEEPRGVGPDGLTQLNDSFGPFAVSQLVDGQAPPQQSPRLQAIVNGLDSVGLTMAVDAQGNLSRKLKDLRRASPESHEALNPVCDDVLQSLDMAAIPLPGGMTQPGQTWTASRSAPADTINSYQMATAEMTYTYRGVRTVNGQDYGIVSLHGVIHPPMGQSSNTGQVNGTAAIDLTAGRVYQVYALVDMTVDVHIKDEALTGNARVEVNLTRSTP